MKLRKFEMWFVFIAVLLGLPLLFTWLGEVAPLLALLGVILGSAVIIGRVSTQLVRSYQKASSPFTGVLVMNGHARIGGHLPRFTILEWALRHWGGLWNSNRHLLIVVCAFLWVICPLDGEVPFGPLGLIDDGFAAVLGFKHFFDLFKGEVAAVHSSVREAVDRHRNDVIDVEVVSIDRERV